MVNGITPFAPQCISQVAFIIYYQILREILPNEVIVIEQLGTPVGTLLGIAKLS